MKNLTLTMLFTIHVFFILLRIQNSVWQIPVFSQSFVLHVSS